MVEGTDYVIAAVRELPSGHFEATATLLHGPGHRLTIVVNRSASLDIPGAVAAHMAAMRPTPTGDR